MESARITIPATPEELAQMIDHTKLDPKAIEADYDKLCDEAIQHGFASVCVFPHWVRYCFRRLKNTNIVVCTVVSFPDGLDITRVKAEAARRAVDDGAREVDMVANLSLIQMSQWRGVESDIAKVVESAKPAHVKVIIEAPLFDDGQITDASKCVLNAGAAFVKGATGRIKDAQGGVRGTTEHHVKLMHSVAGQKMLVKASGGIGNYNDAMRMIKSGAGRIGASAGVRIVSQAREAMMAT